MNHVLRSVGPVFGSLSTYLRRYVNSLAGLVLALGIVLGASGKAVDAQPHHALAVAWFNSHEGFDKVDRSKWGLYYKAPPIPSDWNSSIPGLYYVHNSDPSNEPNDALPGGGYNNGYPARPRLTFPRNVPAGSVIHVHGGPYGAAAAVGGVIKVGGTGSLASPVYVYGNAGGTKTELNRPLHLEGTYIVAQGFLIKSLPASASGMELVGPNHHLVVRNCEITNPRDPNDPPVGGNRSAIGIQGPDIDNRVHDVIVANCTVRDFGDWTYNPTVGDHDEHGVNISAFAYNITLMNNVIYHCEGDGVQINAGCYAIRDRTADVFVYRNDTYENKQSGLWVKFTSRVTLLENKVRDILGSNTNPDGAGMGCQYGPVDLLIEGNAISNCRTGVLVTARSGPGCESWPTLPSPPFPPANAGEGTGLVIKNNEIANIHRAAGASHFVGFGIHLREQGLTYPTICDNELNDCDGGIGVSAQPLTPITALDNLFYGIDATDPHIEFQTLASRCASTLSNNVVVDPPNESLRVLPTGTCP